MSNYTFASMPSVSIARSKFHRTQPHGTSFNLGEIVVLGFDEVIPGSTHKIELGSLIRMSTPIAPIMDDIQYDVYSFFVPMRLTWEHWKQFMGESDQAGISTVTYTIPQLYGTYDPTVSSEDGSLSQKGLNGSLLNSNADDLGIFPKPASGTTPYYLGGISALPFRALALIYNRWFRNQNVEAPIPVYLGDTETLTTSNYLNPGYRFDDSYDVGSTRWTAYKLPDYFTSALPYAQKGDSVKILSDDLPVIAGSTSHAITSNPVTMVDVADGNPRTGIQNLVNNNGKLARSVDAASYSDTNNAVFNNFYARCVNDINDLRFAFQLQKALEKDALYGSRYWEVLRAHYAVTSPDATLQDPELLGHIKFDINISQVLQTTGFSSPSSTNLGTPGANSVTANRSHLFTASFVEHGYIFHIGVARQKRHTYSQGINRLWNRKSRWDFYHPVFANLGAQKVLNKELHVGPGSGYTSVFGFQEAWSEYRFLPGYNSGLLNPNRANSLDYWTLADSYVTTPTLGSIFLKEDRSNLARALVTGLTGPDFIGSFYIKDTVVNPMPLYSIPGFADHH